MTGAGTAPAFRFAVALELAGRPCLVVGGGVVAARKVEALLEAGARVTVVSPALSPPLMRLAQDGRIHWRVREYRRGDVEGFGLVMVATDDGAANALVAAEARERGVWVNCADDPARSDFALPAVLRRGPVTVAVSTGGASPALARLIRDELAGLLPPEWAALADLAAAVRRELGAAGRAAGGERWRRALDGELRRLVAAGLVEEARARLQERLLA